VAETREADAARRGTLRSVFFGKPATRTRSAMSRATSAATAKSPLGASETAIEGTPSSVPSIAADTVPE